MMVGIVLSYWEGNFSGAMLNFGGVSVVTLWEWENHSKVIPHSHEVDQQSPIRIYKETSPKSLVNKAKKSMILKLDGGLQKSVRKDWHLINRCFLIIGDRFKATQTTNFWKNRTCFII